MRLTRFHAPAVLVALLIATPARADAVRILGTDLEAVEARVELVVTAEREILASSFVFGNDPLTLTSLAMLRSAARRGVEVRLMADAFWNRIPRPVLAHILAEGVQVREYHPLTLCHPSWIFRRLHDKLLIADGELLLAGGRNVQSTYYGFGRQIGARNYIDADLLVRGDAAGDARRYFLALWETEDVREVRAKATEQELEAASLELDRHQAWLDERVDRARRDPHRPTAELMEVGAVRFLHDPVGGGVAGRKVGAELRDLLDGARESAIIESPYLVPTAELRESLRNAVDRDVRIRILTNSLVSTDNLLPQAAYVGERKGLVRSGVELWEYKGPESMHAKAAVIDGEIVIVGSYNLDPRSQNLNREIALVARDEDLAKDLLQRMDAHLENAQRIDERGWPEGSDEPFPGVPQRTIWKLRMLRLIAPLIRGQL